MTFFFLLSTMKYNLYVALCCLLLNCGSRKAQPELWELQENTGIRFANHIRNTKDFNIFSYRNFYNGGGVAIGDINNDGLADVFFTANMGENKLYLNRGNWKFEDVTQRSGLKNQGKWGTGVVMVDLNADGWLDIYVCYAGFQSGIGQENELYLNNRDGTFTEAAKEYGLADGGYTTHAAFFDYDSDGDLDCYILNNSFIPVNTLNYANKRELRAEDWPVADFLKGGGDRLLRNDNNRFTDVSKQSGIYGSLIGFGLGVTVGDINGDYHPDIYISNDFFERDYLYINQKNGTFREQLEDQMQHTSLASMGADIGDINNDGLNDIFTTDMLPDDDYRLKTTSLFDNIDVYRLKVNQGFYHQFMQNTLQLNKGNGKFSDIAFYGGVAASDWSWGGLFFDADNDGLLDIYVCNGIYHDVTDQDFIDFFANDVIQKMVTTGKKEDVDQVISKMPSQPILNKFFRNTGNLRFTDEGVNWGMKQPSFSNGAAYGDLDNDGDLDLVVNNVNQEAFVYKNNSNAVYKNNHIAFQLKGKGKNTFAVGSTLKVFLDSQVILREIMPARGFQSSIDYRVVIGLGSGKPDSVAVHWPDGTTTTIMHPDVNRLHVLEQKGTVAVTQRAMNDPVPLLQPMQGAFEKHREDDYVDFYYERGLVHMLSREGPRASAADVNGDGLDDLYIGGGYGQAGQLYLQTAGGFVKKQQADFSAHSDDEETAVLFFDCDQDGDQDLLVGSGGNRFPAQSFQLQSRLYKNDGRGGFTYVSGAVPANGLNTSVAVATDFDSDGDLDLFVGTRNVPRQYGPSPQSFLLLNNGQGQFTDIGPANPDMAFAGMITAAVASDVTGDGRNELILAGEWMSPMIFTFNGSRFERLQTGLDSLSGLWQSVQAADLDQDGDQDLVFGNLGENSYLQPGADRPVKLWISDFDKNATEEKIITRTVEGKDKPVFLKKDLTDQLASLRKQNLKYVDFAKKSIQDLFPPEVMKNCLVKNFNYAGSIIAFNQGNGKFTIQKLPAPVQFSSVHAILCMDLDGDLQTDIVLGGNRFDMQPQFARLDASYGTVLLNKGNGRFRVLPSAESGILLRGCLRDIKIIKGAGRNFLLFLQNNDVPVLFSLPAAQAGTGKVTPIGK